jgi:hypothetical protein
MTDILEQLYDFDNCGITASDRFHLRMAAGKEIERLRAALAGNEQKPPSIVQDAHSDNTGWFSR